jgi:predicted dehydrogenase
MMNLTPEQKAAGKQAFLSEVASGETRRDFLKKAAVAGIVSGGSLGAFYFGYEATLAKPVRVAVLGTGDEGSVLIGALNPNFVDVVAIADVRPYNKFRAFHGDCFSEVARKVRPGLMAKYDYKTEDAAKKHIQVYDDYRELLKAEKDNIDAVIIALPLHLHAPAAIAAMRLGKHVITEKLMGHTVHECKEMARVAHQTGVYLATGHQRHYNILYENAKDQIRRGVFGQLHYIRAQWHRNNLPGNDSWQMPLPTGLKEGDKSGERLVKEMEKWKEELDKIAEKKSKASEVDLLNRMIAQRYEQLKDVALKDTAQKFGYQQYELKNGKGEVAYTCTPAEELIRWRLWDRTGAGLMAELGSHQLDASSIFIGAALEAARDEEKGTHDNEPIHPHPISLMASGTRPIFPDDRDVEDHVFCILDFPAPGYNENDPIDSKKKIGVTYATINGNGFGGYGEVVMGTKGTLVLESEKEAMLFKEADSETKVGVSKGKGPALDTQASGAQAAVGKMATMDVSRGYAEEIEHWAWCIAQKDFKNSQIRPRCYPEVAMGDAIIALVANMAARSTKGGYIRFEKEWFEVDSDDTPEGIKPNPTDPERYPAI